MDSEWKCNNCGHMNDASYSICGDCGEVRKKSSSINPLLIGGIAGSIVLIIILAVGVNHMIKAPEKKYKEALKQCADISNCEEADKVVKMYRIPDEKIKKWQPKVKPANGEQPPTQPGTQPQKGNSAIAEIETKQSLNLGIMHIAAAKANLKNKKLFDESMDNAVKEFSVAIEKASDQALQAKAYEQRGSAYLIQKKFNKALDDLKKASELQPESPTIFYNLACLYSLTKAVDLGLDALDKALSNGFNNYEALKNDTDLTNLRKSPEFKKILEKHNIWLTL
jgi:tetratricopeptide (TPR) repeat protein